jgi:hypothetical protein
MCGGLPAAGRKQLLIKRYLVASFSPKPSSTARTLQVGKASYYSTSVLCHERLTAADQERQCRDNYPSAKKKLVSAVGNELRFTLRSLAIVAPPRRISVCSEPHTSFKVAPSVEGISKFDWSIWDVLFSVPTARGNSLLPIRQLNPPVRPIRANFC